MQISDCLFFGVMQSYSVALVVCWVKEPNQWTNPATFSCVLVSSQCGVKVSLHIKHSRNKTVNNPPVHLVLYLFTTCFIRPTLLALGWTSRHRFNKLLEMFLKDYGPHSCTSMM